MIRNKITELICFIFLLAFFIYGCTPKKVFDDAEIGKEQKLTNPLSNWLIIKQFDHGHIIRSIAPYQWSYKNNINVFLNAKGEIQPFAPEGELAIQGQLGSAHMYKLHTYQIDNLNKDLTEELNKTIIYNDIYQLRVFSTYHFAYDLFIYVNGEDVEYIMVCKDFCRETKAEIIVVTKGS